CGSWQGGCGSGLGTRRRPLICPRMLELAPRGLPTSVSARGPFLELFTLRGTDPFEEALTWEIEPFGPVVAVGRPGRPLGSLGAARDHLPDAVWQPEVARRMGEARGIVVGLGGTDGLAS